VDRIKEIVIDACIFISGILTCPDKHAHVISIQSNLHGNRSFKEYSIGCKHTEFFSKEFLDAVHSSYHYGDVLVNFSKAFPGWKFTTRC
jgi:hypothetical protein